MSIIQKLSTAFLLLALLGFTGCVGPHAHGPLGGCIDGCGTPHCSDCTGCGELYVDPWINHPADCVDPCDMCGNYNGQSCGRCRPIFEGFRSLWGYRCGEDCGGCDAPGCEVVVGGGALGGCECGASICGPTCGCEDACCGGCNSCGSGDVIVDDGGGEIIYEGEHIGGVPTPAGQGIVEINPADGPVKPERTRKIFNPRPRVATGDGRSVGY